MFYGHRKPKHFDVFFNNTKPKFLAKSYFVEKQSYHIIIGLPWAIQSENPQFAFKSYFWVPLLGTNSFFFIRQ